MARVIFKPTLDIPLPPESTYKYFNKIDISNWRYVQECGGGLIFIDKFFRVYEILDISINQFHQLNYNKGVEEKSYKYIKNNLSCTACIGTGIVDWIHKVMGKKDEVASKYVHEFPSYKRNKKGIINVCHFNKLGLIDEPRVTFFLSTPYLKKGEETCPKCLGSGLHWFASKILITKVITLKEC